MMGSASVSKGDRKATDSRNDDELAAAAVAGELAAFGELVRRHQDFVYGAVLRVVKNTNLAEDLTQECFLRAYRALPDFRGDSKVRSWLYRIGTNLALNAVTRAREVPTDILPEVLPISTGPAREAELSELARAMRSAIDDLPEDLREPLVLREIQHLSYEEIAGRLDLPLNTVRTRIFRARRALRDQMEAWR